MPDPEGFTAWPRTPGGPWTLIGKAATEQEVDALCRQALSGRRLIGGVIPGDGEPPAGVNCLNRPGGVHRSRTGRRKRRQRPLSKMELCRGWGV